MEHTHEAAAPPAPDGAASGVARALLIALQRALAAVRIYSIEHPATQQAILEGASAWGNLPDASKEVSIAITAHSFVVGDASIAFSEKLEDLGTRLARAGLAGLTVRSGMNVAQFRALVEPLAAHRHDETDATALVARVAEGTGKLVTLIPLDVRGVKIDERARALDQPDSVRAGDLTALVRFLLRPMGERTDAAAPAALAAIANEWDDDAERAPPLASHTQIAGAMSSATAASRDDISRSLGSFVASLKPDLANAFLRLQPSDPSASMFLYRQLSTSLPVERLVSAMAGVDAAGAPPTIESLRMLEKFVRIAERDSAQSHSLGAVVDNLIEGDKVSNRWAKELGTAMGEILRSRQQNSYTPAEYGTRLDELTTAGVIPPSPLAEERRLEWETVPTRCALVAGALVNDPAQSDEDRRSLLRPLADMLPILAREGHWSVIGSAGVFARSVPVGAQHAEHARRLLDALRSKDYLAPLIDAMLAADSPSDVWIDSFRPAGGIGAVELLERASSTADPRPLAIAIALLRDASVDMALVASLALERGASCVRAVLRAAPEPARAALLLAPMLSDANAETREGVARALSALSAPWPLDLLERALSDPHPPVRLAALRGTHLGADTHSIPLIAALLVRGFEADQLTDEAAAGVEALAARGQDGVTALAGAVRDLARSPLPARLVHARRLRWCAARLGAAHALNAKLSPWTRLVLLTARVVFYNDPRFFGRAA